MEIKYPCKNFFTTNLLEMSEDLFEQNSAIKDEADVILYEKKIMKLLSAYGVPHITGSYALDLMTWRDLDIYLQTDTMNEEKFFRMGAELCKALSPLRMHFRNEVLAKTDKLPDGFYWGIYMGNERKGDWKIDIWAVDTGECERLITYCNEIREQLDDRYTRSILSIKSQCWQDPEYRRIYSSSDIYDAVLKNRVRDMEGFWKYLDNKVV